MSDPGSRPRCLLVTRNLPPLLGGMERLNLELARTLSAWGELRVVGPTGAGNVLAGIPTREVPPSPLSRFITLGTWRALGEARRFRPHVLVSGSGLAAPMMQVASWGGRNRRMVYVHGLDLVAPHPLYRAFWLPAIRRAELVVANSHNTRRLAVSAGVAPERIRILHPGTEIPVLDPAAPERFRTRFDLQGRKVLLSVGRLTARKGLREFVRDALPAIVAAHPDVVLAVVGDEAPHALHREEGSGSAAILEAAEQAGVSASVRYFGRVDESTLEDAYQAADLHVFPVRELDGDVEGFGMVAVEAAVRGLATVGFASGGVPDAVVPGTGELVAPGDYPAIAVAINRWLQAPYDKTGCRQAGARFSWSAFRTGLLGLLQELRPDARVS